MTRISRFRGTKRTNKYGAQKTVARGVTFDSKAEARRNEELHLMKMAGEVKWFQRQPSFLLTGGVRYRPDFIVCGKDGEIWLEDVKGHQTEAFVIKSKIFAELYPTLELRVVK